MAAATPQLKTTQARWQALLDLASQRIESRRAWRVSGRITRATGLVLEATGLRLAVGAACRIEVSASLGRWADAEVVGFHDGTLFLMPQADISGLLPGARVVPAAPDINHRLPLPRQPTYSAPPP